MKKTLLLIFVSLQCFIGIAQQSNAPYAFQSKYHMLDSLELSAPKTPGKAFTSTLPPTGIIRAIAEWEQAQAVLVSYPGNFGIPYTLIKEMSLNCKVITLVTSSAQQTTVTNNYTTQGVNLANCLFKITPVDSYWSRDFGPWFIMNNNSTIGIVDFPYNRPSRPNDDNVPVMMATYLSEPLYGMNVMHTGGNYMADGYGVAAMTNLVLDENTSLTEPQIDTLFKQYMGVTNCYITADPLGDYIKHVDCWGKFLDVDKILVASVPTSNAQYNQYEAMATYWQNKISSYGNNYQVFRAYEPSGQPYSNSFILNNKVFVPIMGGSSATYDAQALTVYQQAMPGYQVFGMLGLTGSNGWVSTDALHCRTHEIADQGMLYIQHYPLLGAKTLQNNYTVNANVYALSTSALIADSMWVKYRVNHGVWQETLMTNPSGNQWTVNIPATAPVAGDTIEYYLHASDQSPRSTMHPLIGAPDPHKFWVAGVTSIQENKTPKTLIFPNPAVDYIFIQPQGEVDGPLSVKIMNAMGKEVMSLTNVFTHNRMLQINIARLACGTYFVNVVSNAGVTTEKIMVMH